MTNRDHLRRADALRVMRLRVARDKALDGYMALYSPFVALEGVQDAWAAYRRANRDYAFAYNYFVAAWGKCPPATVAALPDVERWAAA